MSQFESEQNKETQKSKETLALLRSINRAIIFKNTQSQYFAFALLISLTSIFALICSDIVGSRLLLRNVLCVVCGILVLIGTSFLFGVELYISIRCKNWNERMTAVLKAPNKNDLPLLLASLEAFRNEFVNVEQGGRFTIFDFFAGNVRKDENGKQRTIHRFDGLLEQPLWECIVNQLLEFNEDDNEIIDAASHKILHNILLQKPIYEGAIKIYSEETPKMQLSIISALKVIGDSRDLPTLRDVVSSKIPEIALSVCQEAEVAIEVIQSRMGGEKSRQELLRASSAVSAQPNELLRAANFGGVTPENEMLRVSESPK